MINHLRNWFVFLTIICFIVPFTSIETVLADIEKERYIIMYDPKDNEFLSSIEETIHERYDLISAVSVSLTDEQVDILSQLNAVKSIEKEQVLSVEGQVVDWGISETKATIAQRQGKTGKGVKVAVLDTGIDRNHPDLTVVDGICFAVDSTGNSACPNSYQDDNGHGSHVAGIIGALDNDIGVIGVAPDVELYAVKVLNSEGAGLTSSLLNGMEWAIDQQVDIINLSLATPVSDTSMKALMDLAYDKGILVVAAAGNGGDENGTNNTVEYPAKYDSVISVAALNNQLVRINESATGPELDISAPGYRVFSTIPTQVDYDGLKDGYTRYTGTSMAAPFVSGILALYKQEFPTKSNIELKEMLIENARDLGQVGIDRFYGYGLAQAIPLIKVNSKIEQGMVDFSIPSLPMGITSYDIYRDGILIEKDITTLKWSDYLVKGNYIYEFIVHQDGQEIVTKKYITINEPHFYDLSNDEWFAREMIYLYKNQILNGYSNGDYIRPRQYVTRGEAVALVGRAIGLDGTKGSTSFSDVSSNYFASGYIHAAFEKGIITGYSDKTFRPHEHVTRAQMAILVSNAYHLSASNSESFSDVTSKVTGYNQINSLFYHNITKGFSDGTFRPYETITRSNLGVFIARAEDDRFK